MYCVCNYKSTSVVDLSGQSKYTLGMNKRDERPKSGSPRRKPKSSLLQVRLDEPEKEAFETAAHIAGLGLSAWVRERLRRAARRELEEAGQKIAFLNYAAGEGDQ